MNELFLLSLSAASLGIIHTILGPDHYLPFIVLSRARNWSRSKTMWITLISGIGHVGGSVAIGVIGIVFGLGLNKLQLIESMRGEIIGWALVAFGLAYTIYGAHTFLKKGGHNHLPDFLLPEKIRRLKHQVDHGLEEKEDNTKLTPWILFLIFVFGPCEVLIPLLVFPASQNNIPGIVSVALFFCITTVATMMILVYLGHVGSSLLRFKSSEKYMHLAAGLIIFFSGIGIQFLGW